MGETRNAYKILVVNSEGKKSLGRPKRRWEQSLLFINLRSACQ
jgi:hypothetical protein